MTSTILAIETAADLCGVALLRDAALVNSVSIETPRSHAEKLAPMIGQVVEMSGVSVMDVDVVAVSAGPGSYTGLRIGVSTAKGFCYATGAALVGVDTLLARAFAVRSGLPVGKLIAAVIPSRRHEVYLGAWRVTTEGLVLEYPSAAIETNRARDLLSGWNQDSGVLLAGEGAGRLTSDDAMPLLDRADVAYDARWIGRAALSAIEERRFDDPSAFEPVYLKPFVAHSARSIFDRLPDMRS